MQRPDLRARRCRAASILGLLATLGLAAGCSSGDGAVAALTAPSGAGGATTTTSGASPTTTARSATAPATTAPPAGGASSGNVAAGITAIQVASTTSQYFVLWVKPDVRSSAEVPVAIVKGKAGTTTITDGRKKLSDDHYRVETLAVDKPGDVDGDGIDDLTELADPANLNPLNPAPKLDARTGAVIVPDLATYQALSYQGNDVARDQYLAGIEFMKFWIVGTNTAHPAVYFMNTNTFKAHPEFASVVGIAAGRGPTAGTMRGDIAYSPDAIAPDGSKGRYRFAFQPTDAYSFKDIALAYELLVASMPMLHDNLVYEAYPQAALPLYQKEKALYDAYRVPVLVA